MNQPIIRMPLISTYQAAAKIAPVIEAHFAEHLASSKGSERYLASRPSASVIEALIDTAFWASLRREEGTRQRSLWPYFRRSRLATQSCLNIRLF